jgi:hypothetical protein
METKTSQIPTVSLLMSPWRLSKTVRSVTPCCLTAPVSPKTPFATPTPSLLTPANHRSMPKTIPWPMTLGSATFKWTPVMRNLSFLKTQSTAHNDIGLYRSLENTLWVTVPPQSAVKFNPSPLSTSFLQRQSPLKIRSCLPHLLFPKQRFNLPLASFPRMLPVQSHLLQMKSSLARL